MNLNGQSSKSQTILNGRPLYGYDRMKRISYIKHSENHQREIQKWKNYKKTQKHVSLDSIKETLISIIIAMFIIGSFIFSFG